MSDRGAAAPAEHFAWAQALDAAGIIAYCFDPAAGTFAWSGSPASSSGLPSPLPRALANYLGLVAPADRAMVERGFADLPSDVDSFDVEYRLGGPGGEVWVHDRGCFETSGDRRLRVGAINVLSASRNQRPPAGTDELTGFASRSTFLQKLGTQLHDAFGPEVTGLLMVAVGGLGVVNETYGIIAGDRMVAAVAARLHSVLDRPFTVGRLAGNRFAVLLPGATSDSMALLAERIMRTVRGTVLAEVGVPVIATVSIGGTLLARGTASLEDALAHGKEALHKARRRGQEGYAEFRASPEHMVRVRRQAQIASTVIEALRDDRIELAFQPVVAAADGRVAFYEALVRLRQRDGTLIPAGDFVPFTERSGLIQIIDRRTLSLAIEVLLSRPDVQLSINVSARTLEDEGWSTILERFGRAAPDAAARLAIELTESAAIEEMEEASRILGVARTLGCRVLLDDFGGGYLTPRHLRQLAIDLVKIDGSYIRDLASDHSNSISVASMVALAAAYNIPTVAEHVETEADAEICRDLGIEYLQGYLFSRPGPLPAA